MPFPSRTAVKDFLRNLTFENTARAFSSIPTLAQSAVEGRLHYNPATTSTPRRKRRAPSIPNPPSKRQRLERSAVVPSRKLFKENANATMPKRITRSRKRARKASLRGKLRSLRKRKSLARVRRRRSVKSKTRIGAVKLARSKRGDTYIATLPRMPRSHTFKFPLFATYEFTIAPKDRLSYMTATYANTVDGVTTLVGNAGCQVPIGFVVNVNAPHRPFDLLSTTVNQPFPNNVSDGWIFAQNQPIGMKDLLLWLNVNSNARSEHIVCYATDVSYTLERPVHEIFEYKEHGRDYHLRTGIEQGGSFNDSGSNDYYDKLHSGNTRKYYHASWISRAQSDFTNLDELHASAKVNSINRIDPDAIQTFKRNLLGDKALQGDFTMMNVPQKKSTFATGHKKWSITDYPLYAPHPFNKKSPYARQLWQQDADTELSNPVKDYVYNPSSSSIDAITGLGAIAPSKFIRMPVLVQPDSRPRDMLSHTRVENTGTGEVFITDNNVHSTTNIQTDPYTIQQAVGQSTESMFDLPYIRVKLKLKYHMAILPGISMDGVAVSAQPQVFDEPTFTPLSAITP